MTRAERDDLSDATARAAGASADIYAQFVNQAKAAVAKAAEAVEATRADLEAASEWSRGPWGHDAAAAFDGLADELRAAAEGLSVSGSPLTQSSEASAAEKPIATAARRLTEEIGRLLGDLEIDEATIDRAARIVTAEHSWRDGLGIRLTEPDAAKLLGVPVDRLEALRSEGSVIALVDRFGVRSYPAYQFEHGAPSPVLARAHRVLVEKGSLSEWSAASWGCTPHPELEQRTPAQWSAEGRDEDRLLVAAGRDASRLRR
jgi:hypothetical protein